MPSVIINDVPMEAKVGERLLNVARRNAAHIGFVCDGNGICQTCQVRVLAGADQLSPPSEAELDWMPARRLRDGHRLACQTTLRGSGTVELLTNAEELRRQTLDLVRPREDRDIADRMRPLLENLARMSADQLVRYPWNLLAALARVGPLRLIYPLRDPGRWSDDAARVARRMGAGLDRLERAPQVELGAVSRAARRAAGQPAPAVELDEVARAARRAADPTAPAAPPPPPDPQSIAEARAIEAARALRRARRDRAQLVR